MGSTILRALARQGHPTSPAGLRTYREAAGANPCAQALLVSRATRFRRSRVARASGSRLGFAQRTGPIPRCQRGNPCRSRRKPVPRGAPLRVCPPPRSYGPEGMRSCERTADDEHPVAARPQPAVAVGSPGDIVARARLAGSPERTSWPVAAKPSLWPPPIVWPRGPSNQSCRRRTAQSSATSDTVGLTSKEAHPFLCSLVTQRRAL